MAEKIRQGRTGPVPAVDDRGDTHPSVPAERDLAMRVDRRQHRVPRGLRVWSIVAVLIIGLVTVAAAVTPKDAAAIQFYGTPEPTPHETLRITDPFPTPIPEVVVANLPSVETTSPIVWVMLGGVLVGGGVLIGYFAARKAGRRD